MLRNIPEERETQVHGGGSVKSRISYVCTLTNLKSIIDDASKLVCFLPNLNVGPTGDKRQVKTVSSSMKNI
jgi:hypothetical protein